MIANMKIRRWRLLVDFFPVYLLLLSDCLFQNSSNNIIGVDAYPNEAGACHGNQAAVKGSHVTSQPSNTFDDDRMDTTTPGSSSSSSINTNRLIQTGSIEENTHRLVYINGRPISSTGMVELQYGIEYLIEIIATGGHPFKGVLLRIESLAFTEQERQDGVSLFTLEPLTNAQSAEACSSGDPTSTIQGVTHFDNTLKYAFSSSLVVSPPMYNTSKHSYFAMDVTVVDYNNATGSVYWYSQYTLEGVVQLSNDENENAITVVAPIQPSQSPTSSPYPTYMNKCYVCHNETARVVNPTTEILILNEASTCSEIEYEGRHGLIPPQHCTIVQVAVFDACGCEEIPVATPMTHNGEFPTVTPSITANPTMSEMPTSKQKCYVCNGDANQIIMNALHLIQLEGETGTCIELHDNGLEGYIPPELCLEAQTQASMYCNCTNIPDLEPTKSPAPSASPYPSYSEKCYVCSNDENQRITAIDRIVNVDGRIGTCFDLQEQGLEGYIHPTLCSDAQQIAARICDCQPFNATPSVLKTFAPSITPFPTFTNSPTYDSVCHVCGEENAATTLGNVVVALDGMGIACKELEKAGLERSIPPHVCSEAQKQALLWCGCVQIKPPTPTMIPTYAEKCSVCGSNTMEVTRHKTLVLVQNQVLNCEELWEAGKWGLIPPQYCDESKKMATEFCGCTESNSVAAPTSLLTLSPTVTPEPTITSSPTYREKCDICPDYSSDGSDNDSSNNPTDSTRTVRNTNGDVTSMSGVLDYDGILWDCNVLHDLGDSGNISPALCPIFQEKAKVSCPCNAHKTRDDPLIPKPTSHATIVQYSFVLYAMVASTIIAIASSNESS